MSVLYSQAEKSKYRITLELETLSDFNPHDISWEKVFELQDMRGAKVSLKIWVILSVGNNKGEPLKCYYSVDNP